MQGQPVVSNTATHLLKAPGAETWSFLSFLLPLCSSPFWGWVLFQVAHTDKPAGKASEKGTVCRGSVELLQLGAAPRAASGKQWDFIPQDWGCRITSYRKALACVSLPVTAPHRWQCKHADALPCLKFLP